MLHEVLRAMHGAQRPEADNRLRTETARNPATSRILAGFVFMELKQAINEFSAWRKFKVKKSTVRGYDRELRNFCLFLRNPYVEDITIHQVMEYLNGVVEMGWDHNSLLPRCMALRKFFEFLRLQEYKVLDPELIPIPNREYKMPRVADEGNYKKLLSAVPKKTNDPRHIRNLAIINLLWDTGARNGEILAMNVSDLDLEGMRAVIRTEKSKGRRPIRQVFWTEETNENIKRWVKKRAELAKKIQLKEPDALFISATSRQTGQRLSIKGVGEMLRRYSNKAKIPYMNAHSFRHHMGHDIVKKGGSASDVMNILGHASMQSSALYTMMEGKELENRYRHFQQIGNERKARSMLNQEAVWSNSAGVPARVRKPDKELIKKIAKETGVTEKEAFKVAEVMIQNGAMTSYPQR